MKVACVDKTAADRIKLQKQFDHAFEQYKTSFGHISLAQTFPCSHEDILLQEAPAIIAIGSTFSFEEAYGVGRKLKLHFPEAVIFVFLTAENYSLRALRRFQNITSEIFSLEEENTRLVHAISNVASRKKEQERGKLITLTGVKGGVGVTSIASALAHSAEAMNKSAIVVDLSASHCLTHYLAAQRWHSAEYSALLQENTLPDIHVVDKLITTAPNGITMLLPPSGGTEIRELWIRNQKTFEVTLEIVEMLKSKFDLVIVDTANAEGILPFSLNANAFAKVLISSNDPASAHLLNTRLTELSQMPGDGQIHIVINENYAHGLHKEDIVDFLSLNTVFNPTMAIALPLSFDAKAGQWIGTGNSFYTEGSSATQNAIDELLSTIQLCAPELEIKLKYSTGLFSGFRLLSSLLHRKKRLQQPRIKALPAPCEEKNTVDDSCVKKITPLSSELQANFQNNFEKLSSPGPLFEPPTLQVASQQENTSGF